MRGRTCGRATGLGVLGTLAAFFAAALGACLQGDTTRADEVDAGSGGQRTAAAPTTHATPILITQEHFRLSIDGNRGGEITDLQLFDGSAWNHVLGAGGATFPAATLRSGDTDFALARATDAHVEVLSHTPELDIIRATAVPRSADGRASSWQMVLDYEVHRAGGVFVKITYRLGSGEATLASADLAFDVDGAVTRGPRYREEVVQSAALPSARIAFGVDASRSLTNEIEVVVEDAKALAGKSSFATARGHFAWKLANGSTTLRAPFAYTNRISLGLGSSATGAPRSNLVGQRPYHWVSRLGPPRRGKDWFPTDAQIDTMAQKQATMLVLHNFWMAQGGSNGFPHADYGHARDDAELRRVVARAHDRNLRVGLYTRGIERSGLAMKFFERYLRRGWDGLYVDWHGAHAISAHEHGLTPESRHGDTHYSTDGSYLPARDYFLYMQALRDSVGSRGFLIGHQGSFSSGVLANLDIDAYLPGEASFDHGMLATVDEATYRGMMGGGVAMPWTVDAPASFTSREGIAKMAAWGLYPDVPLGIYDFPADPSDPAVQYTLPYWRLLAAGRAEDSIVYNTPSVDLVAARSSSPTIRCVVYKHVVPGADPELMVIAANLSEKPSSGTLTLVPDVLGISGEYRLTRVDPATGALTSAGKTSATIETGDLTGWELAGWKLSR